MRRCPRGSGGHFFGLHSRGSARATHAVSNVVGRTDSARSCLSCDRGVRESAGYGEACWDSFALNRLDGASRLRPARSPEAVCVRVSVAGTSVLAPVGNRVQAQRRSDVAARPTGSKPKSIAEFRRMHREAVAEAGAELVRFARSWDWCAASGSRSMVQSSSR